MIAIIYTTFLRDELMYKTIQSILDNWNKDYYLLVGDQGNHTEEKDKWFKEKGFGLGNKQYIKFEFDVGAYVTRNALIKKVKELKIPYCWITADSIEFISKYNCKPIVDFLEENQTRGIVGLDIEKRIPWEGDIEIQNNRFLLDAPQQDKIEKNEIQYQPVDICRNFFIAKTNCLINNLWDENFKVGCHEGYFYNLKKTKWQVFFTNYIRARYIESKPKDYNKFRRRIYSSERQKLKKKFNLKGWVKYTPEMRETFRKFKNKKN